MHEIQGIFAWWGTRPPRCSRAPHANPPHPAPHTPHPAPHTLTLHTTHHTLHTLHTPHPTAKPSTPQGATRYLLGQFASRPPPPNFRPPPPLLQGATHSASSQHFEDDFVAWEHPLDMQLTMQTAQVWRKCGKVCAVTSLSFWHGTMGAPSGYAADHADGIGVDKVWTGV